MSLGRNLGAIQTYEERFGSFMPGHRDYYRHPAAYAVDPFRIADGLYYVGDRRVCVHLLDTGDGLILFDSGYQHTKHLLLHSVWKLGYRPTDIRYVIHTHGHFDHFGASEELRSLFGCKLLLSRADGETLRKNPRAALMEYNPDPYAGIPEFDGYLEDGQVFELGNRRIRCLLTPGHSPGVMTFLFDVTEKGESLRVGLFGGVGFLTLYKEYLSKYGQPMDLPLQLLHSIDRLKGERVDIVLGNHPQQNGTLEKREYQLSHPGENPFVDRNEWMEFLEELRENTERFISLGY